MLWTWANIWQSRATLAQTMDPVPAWIVVLMLMDVSTLVMFSDVSLKRSSASRRKASAFVSSFPLMGGMRARMQNLDWSLASSNDFVRCVQSKPSARWPMLSLLRLVGHRTARNKKSHLAEMTSRMCSMVLERLAMRVVALSVSANSSAVSVSSGGQMVFVLLSKAAKMMRNLTLHLSALATDKF